ncbi:MAG: GNAT family N-acetyltransferase [Candidatus Eremiobacteraeota bacterium]|nr:GNAT family N-acetyltransferase [Candidatus Eremiobacteraeota bacterium]
MLRADIDVGPIRAEELRDAVRIFLGAFSENVKAVYGDSPRPDAMLDVWTFFSQDEPGGFLAAREGCTLIGYALFTASLKRLQRDAVVRGQVLRWTLRALSGRYGIQWLQLGRVLWNKILFVGSSGRFRTQGDAQLLNIAVEPAARGRGAAKALVVAGMEYLAGRGVPEVRLEVRPDNAAAIRVYRGVGFVERGQTRDAHGDWLVMTADLAGRSGGKGGEDLRT